MEIKTLAKELKDSRFKGYTPEHLYKTIKRELDLIRRLRFHTIDDVKGIVNCKLAKCYVTKKKDENFLNNLIDKLFEDEIITNCLEEERIDIKDAELEDFICYIYIMSKSIV